MKAYSLGKKLTIGVVTFLLIFVVYHIAASGEERLAKELAIGYAQRLGLARVKVTLTRELSDNIYVVKGQGSRIGSYYDSVGSGVFKDYYIINDDFTYYVNAKLGLVSKNIPDK